MSTAMPEIRPADRLGTPETRRFLNDFVKRRVGESHVDDIVQTVLVNALEAESIPASDSELRRWLTGIARHKIADLHRKSGRERPEELPDIESPAPPVEERLMTEWAEKQANRSKDASRTLEWMAREGEGEKLEHIAAEEKLEAATVRQRVSRMRRWMKERWLAELAAAAALGVLAFLVWSWLKKKPEPEIVRDVPTAQPETPFEQARVMRRAALDACDASRFDECLRGLDQAKELDPAGDETPEVRAAREKAKRPVEAPTPPPTTSSAPTAAPTLSATPVFSTTAPKPPAPEESKKEEAMKKLSPRKQSAKPTSKGFDTPSFSTSETPPASTSPSAPKK